MKFRVEYLLLGAAGLLFFLSSSLLSLHLPFIFNSPDENANAIFTEVFAHTGTLTVSEPLNVIVGGVLHPRSVVAVGDRLVPGSFLGLPVLYGIVAAVVGTNATRFLTPLLAVLAAFAWFALTERLFASRRVAFVSALALLFHPAFWYYAGRSMMHNVPFVCFLIFAAAVFVLRPFDRWKIDSFIAGLLLGVALFFRTFEALWILPLVFILFIVCRKKLCSLHEIWIFFVGVLVAMTPLIALNVQLYGGPFLTGYTYRAAAATIASPGASDVQTQLTGNSNSLALTLLTVKHWLGSTWRNVWAYGVTLFPWLAAASIVGALVLLGEKRRRDWVLVTLVVSVVLALIYGGWNFNDNPNPNTISIGTSYVRYWLPIFVLSTPLIAESLIWLSHRARAKSAASIILGGLVLLMFGLSVSPVFFATDGLEVMRQSLQGFVSDRAQVLAATEPSSVIVVDRDDKILWPERQVIQPLRDDTTYASLPIIAKSAPLYYFGLTLPETDLDYLNQQKLPGLGLQIQAVKTIDTKTLYKIYAP